MSKFYVTYPCGTKLGNSYSVIEAESYALARAHVSNEIGCAWAFLYEEGEKADAIDPYNLTEVPLQAPR